MTERVRLQVAQDSHPEAVALSSRARRERSPVSWLPEEWQARLKELGEPGYRSDQIFRWIHREGVFDPTAMTNLSKGLRSKLSELNLKCPLEVESVRRSSDGTRKLLLRLHDGLLVECVMIPRDHAEDLEEHGTDASEEECLRPVTLCISTQVGCAMGCVFCASGQAGLKRGLGADEVVTQVLLAQRYLDPTETLRNLVFMGMGEPLHHYAETARTIRLLTNPKGRGMSPRRITVSTVGLIAGIEKLGRDFDGKIGLAISLHAPDTKTRSQIIPMNEHHPLPSLISALKRYPLPKRRRITIEYTLIDGVNDQAHHAHALVRTLADMAIKVNLIPMNPIAQSELRKPKRRNVQAFQEILAQNRISCSIRQTRGDDVDAACGQLALA